MKQESRVI